MEIKKLKHNQDEAEKLRKRQEKMNEEITELQSEKKQLKADLQKANSEITKIKDTDAGLTKKKSEVCTIL